MRTFFLGDEDSLLDFFGAGSDLIQTAPELMDPAAEDVLFDFRDEAWDMKHYAKFKNLVFINAVTGTLSDHQAPDHIIRINGWPGMLTRKKIEAVARESVKAEAANIMGRFHKEVEWVTDVPGLISPRVISMIINEACFAEKEGVSNRNSIDIAMKLGTNYPKGPFEWADQIGWKRIGQLLQTLSSMDNRYIPAEQLKRYS
jgi:3-hydroxybutyryl-CoA dehydrogenase